jgi:hypothetical protein
MESSVDFVLQKPEVEETRDIEDPPDPLAFDDPLHIRVLPKRWSAQPQLKELELCMTEVQDNLIKPTTSLIDMVIVLASH